MEYRDLGRTGVRVSPLCLGTAFRSQEDEQTCVRIIDRALDLGCNFIDTALYGEGRSEQIVGRALRGKRNDVVLTTKIFSTLGQGPNSNRLSRLNLMTGIEASLQRLQTGHIDLYLLHSFDPHTPLEETLGALDDLVRQGKVRYIGFPDAGLGLVCLVDMPSLPPSPDTWNRENRHMERQLPQGAPTAGAAMVGE